MSYPTFEAWLNRKSAGPKPKKPLPRVTKKRAKQLREYSVKRQLFLNRHPYCQVFMKERGHKESEVIAAGGFAPGGFGQVPFSVEVHHRAGRVGDKLNDDTLWLAVSRDAHERIHRDPKWARANGFLLNF